MYSSDGGLLCLLSVVYSVLLHFVVCAVCTQRSMPSGCSALRVLRACLRGRSVAGVGCVGSIDVLCTCCRLCASCCVVHPTHRTHSALNPPTQRQQSITEPGVTQQAASTAPSALRTAHTHTHITHHISVSLNTHHTSHKDKNNNKYMRPALPTHSTQG